MARIEGEGGTWTEWGKYVLMTVEQLLHEIAESKRDCARCRELVNKELAEIKKQVAVNAIKLSFVCAAISAAVTLGVKYLVK